jgi:hypothetical protein
MKKLSTTLLVVSFSVLFGGLSFWAVCPNETREFACLEQKALCILELRAGIPSTCASLTISQPTEELHAGLRPRQHGERFSLSISGNEGSICSATTDATRFGWKHQFPPGTYQVTLSQEVGNHGALVVVASEKPIYVTGWQIWSGAYLGLLALSAVCAAMGHKSRNQRVRTMSLCLFQIIPLGFVLIFLYLFFHEGGHALGEIAFGHYDFARSDFWGIHGTPHSAGTSGPPLQPWQQAVISGGGPIFPTLAGWAIFLLVRSRFGRNLRNSGPIINLYLSAAIAILVIPWIAVAGCLLGIVTDGDWHGFITNVPGPLWLIKGILWGILVVNAIILRQVVPDLWRSLLSLAGTLRK